MIDLPDPQDYRALKTFHEPFCVSLYVPSPGGRMIANPNRIALKNLLRDTEKALRTAGAPAATISATLQPARDLLDSQEFWPPRQESLALFMHPKLFRYYHLPDITVTTPLTIADSFNLDPLKAVRRANRRYHVLALSHKHVQLYEGDRYRLAPLTLDNFPTDLKSALGIDEYPKWRETHQIAPAAQGKGAEAFHSQYNVNQTDKIMLLEFFRRIDRRLHKFLSQHQTPLIIAGVDYLLPIYRRANTYQHVLPDSIIGNLEHASLSHIREQAWQLVESSRPA